MKSILFTILFLLSPLFLISGNTSTPSVNVLQAIINEKIEKGEKNIIIPPGEYRIAPCHKSHLTLQQLNDVTIDATGVKMICLETTRAITCINCTNVTLKGLTIDYDPLCFTQGRIINLSKDKKVIDFRIDDGYPENLTERIEIFDSKTLRLKRETYYGWGSFKKIAAHTYRIKKNKDYQFNAAIDKEEIGDIIVTNNIHEPNGSLPHAIYSDHCKNLRFEDITLYSGNCFAFFETNGTKNTYLRCKVKRCPPDLDYKKRAMRIRSNNADAFHSKFAHIGPQLIHCEASFQGDDGLNICGKYYFSTGASNGNIRIIPSGGCDLSIGDTIEVVTYEGERLPLLCVQAISKGEKIDNADLEKIKSLPANEGVKSSLLQRDNYYLNIQVDKMIDFGLGAVVGNKNKMGNGFLVRDCNFSYNRSRGVLIKGSNGKVQNNVFVENWMSSILVTPETWWLESGCSDNVLIEGNKIIKNKKRYAIDVTGCGFSQKIAPVGLHNNIVIKDNQFVLSPSPMIRFQSVRDGEVINNCSSDTNKTESIVRFINCE